MRSLKWLAISVAVTIAVTAILWYFVGPGAFFFLFLPFAFRLGGSRDPEPRTRECPRCGWRSADPADRFCPKDGAELT